MIKAGIKFCLRIVIASLFGWLLLPLLTFAAPQTNFYIIKLHNSDTQKLVSIDQSAQRLFAFSKDPVFQNIFRFQSTQSISYLQNYFSNNLDYLEADHSLKTQVSFDLNDPGYTQNPSDIDKAWGLAKAGFTDAWNKTTGNATTIVAVIDTGIDLNHEDLQLLTPVPGYDFTTNKPLVNRTDSDDNGHGTLITGVLAATPNNNKGIAGTNWQIGIMPVKALDTEGQGTASTISQAIVWAADHGASIINLSVGGLGFAHDATLANAITYAYQKNVLLVAAVGNDAVTGDGNLDTSPVFPVCDDNGDNMVLGVTATDYHDQKPEFANYGKSCIDVSAPGKRILSTINHDPITKRPVSDAYAYASGSSLAVPFVAGQAALLKSLYPKATNRQIRDRIITTADNIDNLNIVQCAGQPCQGLLGAGRINVARSLDQEITAFQVKEDDVVRIESTGQLFLINGGRRQPISPFVLRQRFQNTIPVNVTESDIAQFPEGQFAPPLDGTLIKTPSEATVYSMSGGLKFPVTYQIFQRYNFKFSDIQTLSANQVKSWLTASLLPPPEGTLIKSTKNPTVYWVVGGVLHPINFGFYKARGLNVFPILIVSDNDLKAFAKGEAYIQ